MASYNELIAMVRDWTNRDSSVLPDSVVKSNLRYAADEAYRLLEIPPMEYVEWYVVNDGAAKTQVRQVAANNYVSVNTVFTDLSEAKFEGTTNPYVDHAIMCIPEDAVTFVYLRTNGYALHPEVGDFVDGVAVTSDNQEDYIIITNRGNPLVAKHAAGKRTVYNEKSNIRNLYDFTDNYSMENYWARRGGQIVAAGDIAPCDIFELVYHRRLPALNARELLDSTVTLALAQGLPLEYEVIDAATWATLPAYEQDTYTELEGSYVRSVEEVDNWLKDENERVLLFGALYRCFDYLQEDQQAEKYKQRFMEAIAELNNEEKKRELDGGAVTTIYGSGNLI